MRLLLLFVLLIVMVIGAAFTMLNAATVPFNYYFGSTELPLSLLLVLALILGAFLGLLSSLGMLVGLKRQNRKLKQRAKEFGEEVNKLRTSPLNDL